MAVDDDPTRCAGLLRVFCRFAGGINRCQHGAPRSSFYSDLFLFPQRCVIALPLRCSFGRFLRSTRHLWKPAGIKEVRIAKNDMNGFLPGFCSPVPRHATRSQRGTVPAADHTEKDNEKAITDNSNNGRRPSPVQRLRNTEGAYAEPSTWRSKNDCPILIHKEILKCVRISTTNATSGCPDH